MRYTLGPVTVIPCVSTSSEVFRLAKGPTFNALCTARCSDRWGHVSIGVSDVVYAADTVISFGGFNSEIYFSTVTDQVGILSIPLFLWTRLRDNALLPPRVTYIFLHAILRNRCTSLYAGLSRSMRVLSCGGT